MAFKVTVEPSGVVFEVEGEESVLDAAVRLGINLPYGCRNAVCGSCKARLLEGEVDYGGFETAGLNDEERAQGYALLCRALPRSDLRIESEHVLADTPPEVQRYAARVARKELLNHDVVRLHLALPDAQRMPFFSGQYLDILLDDGRRRSFSIANAPHHDEFIELHIRHVEGGEYTDYIFHHMQEDEVVTVEGPFGSFYFREDSDRPIILMAGGTGFAPIKGIVEHAIAEQVTRPMHFYWGARARRDLYLGGQPLLWAKQLNLTYVPVLSDPLPGDNWQGRTGFVHEAVAADFPQLSGHDIYLCGPPVMVYAGRDRFLEQGAQEARLFSDAFEFAKD